MRERRSRPHMPPWNAMPYLRPTQVGLQRVIYIDDLSREDLLTRCLK